VKKRRRADLSLEVAAAERGEADRLFRRSGLMREEWDEAHYADGSTHGEKTSERAVAGVSEYYDSETAGGVDSMSEPTGKTSRRQAHLAEKNRLLTEHPGVRTDGPDRSGQI